MQQELAAVTAAKLAAEEKVADLQGEAGGSRAYTLVLISGAAVWLGLEWPSPGASLAPQQHFQQPHCDAADRAEVCCFILATEDLGQLTVVVPRSGGHAAQQWSRRFAGYAVRWQLRFAAVVPHHHCMPVSGAFGFAAALQAAPLHTLNYRRPTKSRAWRGCLQTCRRCLRTLQPLAPPPQRLLLSQAPAWTRWQRSRYEVRWPKSIKRYCCCG